MRRHQVTKLSATAAKSDANTQATALSRNSKSNEVKQATDSWKELLASEMKRVSRAQKIRWVG